MNNPLVSIIVRTKDRPRLLKRALQSIASQSYRPLEVVLVNDGGCDLDVGEIKALIGNVELNYVSLGKNTGRAHAGNIGIENAKGKYAGFLDDDDELYPEHVEILAHFLERSDYKIAYTDAFFVYKDYEAETCEIENVKKELAFSKDFEYNQLLFENYIPFMCLLFDKNVLVGSGGFDDNLDLYEDWDLLIRLGEKYPFHHIKKGTADYNQWSNELQISQRNRDQLFLKHSYQQVLSNHLKKLTPAMVHGYVSAHGQTKYLVQELEKQLHERSVRIVNLETTINGMSGHVTSLEAATKERDAHISNLEGLIREKEANTNNLNGVIRDISLHMSTLEGMLRERVIHIDNLEATIKGMSGHVTSLEAAIKERDSCLSSLEGLIREKEVNINNLNGVIKDLKLHISTLEGMLRDRAIHIDNLETTVKGMSGHVTSLEAAIKERDTYIVNLEVAGREKDCHITAVENALREKESYVQMIHSGQGWRLLNKYFTLRDRLLPVESSRRLFGKLFLKLLANPKEVFRNLNKTNFHKFLYYLKTADSVTLEKKIEQKLSDEFTEQNIVDMEKTDLNFTSSLASKDYFRFLFEMNTKKGEDYVPISQPTPTSTDIRLIAFYLPQFHPIPENDEWWGKGFTEWFNVTRAVPQFIGHYQPRLPEELGYYDLRIPDIQKRQIELAEQYGINGFCFHFYWFNGKTLLEKPLKQFVENFDFPFCINWANENWTRRWDGKDNDVLIGQKHSPEDDVAFIEYVSSYLKNKNYIKIQGKPLLIVYRPALFPNMKATATRWRGWCLNNGIGEIYLATTHSFEHIDPVSIGFDAAIEFPPNTYPLKDVAAQFNMANPNFKGVVMDYRDAVEFSRKDVKPFYKKFRGICPNWDNEARKPGRGTVLVNSSPFHFKQWLKALCNFTHNNFEPEERLIFINAWNEWAEGAYLEPDRRYGYAYLQAVSEALIEYNSDKKQKKIIYVCHDAHFHGAQLLSLHIIKTLKLKFNYDVQFILKSGGELEADYARYATVYNLEKSYRTPEEKKSLIKQLYESGIRDAICNTVVSGDIARLLHETGIKVITLVHELPDIIKKMGLEENSRSLAEASHTIVFPSDFVREKFKTIASVADQKTIILPQGLFKYNPYINNKSDARKALRESLSLPENAQIVLGVGFGDYRKGVDLFVEVAGIVSKKIKDVYFVWVGNLHIELEKMVSQEVAADEHIIVRKAQRDISVFYAGADMYLLPSREDPFPIVVLDAMHAGLPVIGFNEAGGFKDIVNENTGALVPYLDLTEMAKEVINLLNNTDRRKLIGDNAQKLIERDFNFTDYIFGLLSLLGHTYKKISVIIPNYNYERYLKSRINSVLKQSYPLYEIILLDDFSADNSVKIVEGYLEENLNMKLVKNETNSGSAFKQWLKGLQMAKGDYIWIAEADDLCENTFVEELLSCFDRDSDVVLAYCQSRQIDEKGMVLARDYLEYTNDIDKEKWKKDYLRDGIREISDTLVIKNTVPNVSAVVFKKAGVMPITSEFSTFKIAGDWFFYADLLRKGKIAYLSKPLNSHRRHDKGITKSENKRLHYNEVIRIQDSIMKEFDVSDDATEKVRVYREYLIRYLGLTESNL